MTKQEHTNIRPLNFSNWIRNCLPDSSNGYMVTDQDWIFWDFKRRKLLLAEEKTYMAEIAPWFYNFICNVLNPALAQFCDGNHIDYRGYHLIQFENTSPKDGRIYLDKLEVTPKELRDTLAMIDRGPDNPPIKLGSMPDASTDRP